jgi:hypothetical protein
MYTGGTLSNWEGNTGTYVSAERRERVAVTEGWIMGIWMLQGCMIYARAYNYTQKDMWYVGQCNEIDLIGID